MTLFQDIKEKLKSGWYWQEIKYEKPAITVYRLEKDNFISYLIGKSSLRYFKGKIKSAKYTSIALNFIPKIPNKNCTIYVI
jgi:hypothetical protein